MNRSDYENLTLDKINSNKILVYNDGKNNTNDKSIEHFEENDVILLEVNLW